MQAVIERLFNAPVPFVHHRDSSARGALLWLVARRWDRHLRRSAWPRHHGRASVPTATLATRDNVSMAIDEIRIDVVTANALQADLVYGGTLMRVMNVYLRRRGVS
jgi:hypothetical protein